MNEYPLVVLVVNAGRVVRAAVPRQRCRHIRVADVLSRETRIQR